MSGNTVLFAMNIPQQLKGNVHPTTDTPDALLASSPRLRSLISHAPTTHQVRSLNSKAFDTVTGQLRESLETRGAAFHPGRTNDADFRSDAALAARAVLSPRDYVLWKNSFLDFTVSEERIPVEIAKHIRLTAGREFVRRRLNNTGLYFQKQQQQSSKEKESQ